jgi:hypothetical protein
MNPIIIYCSKTGNTEKVAQSVARGLDGKAEMVKLELSPEGILKEFLRSGFFRRVGDGYAGPSLPLHVHQGV